MFLDAIDYNKKIEKQIANIISEFFYENLFKGMFEIINISNRVYNAKTTLLQEEIIKGNIYYQDGAFYSKRNKFSNAVAVELEKIGAKYSKWRKAYVISVENLDAQILWAIQTEQARTDATVKALVEFLSFKALELPKLSEELVFGEIVNTMFLDLQKRLYDNAKKKKIALITPKLDDFRLQEIHKNYVDNLHFWIKGFSQQEISKMREDILQMVLEGKPVFGRKLRPKKGKKPKGKKPKGTPETPQDTEPKDETPKDEGKPKDETPKEDKPKDEDKGKEPKLPKDKGKDTEPKDEGGKPKETPPQSSNVNSIAEYIQNRLGVNDRKALFLARNENAIATASYLKAKYTSEGFKYFRWNDSHDERVRELHRELGKKENNIHGINGTNIFSFDNPPVIYEQKKKGVIVRQDRGLPAETYNCRCTMSVYVDKELFKRRNEIYKKQERLKV